MADNKQNQQQQQEQLEPRELSLEEMDSIAGGALEAETKSSKEMKLK
jgi:hypothetical protein